MKAAVLHGARDVRLEELDAPKIIEPTDAILRLSASCICGSDLWPYRGIQSTSAPTPMGHEYCGIVEEVPAGQPEKALVHDFPDDSVGKAVPYGVYEMARNEAYVAVGCDHDTPAFAVASIRQWWMTMGRRAYGNAGELLITADAGGSNGYRARAWKSELQDLADEFRLRILVSHFPPGTSKWNKIEHRLFCHITQNWRGKPLRTFETVVALTGHTRTSEGLRVRARLDTKSYPLGVSVTDATMKSLALHRHVFHGEWNYELRPH